jgi:hypothetical protein
VGSSMKMRVSNSCLRLLNSTTSCLNPPTHVRDPEFSISIEPKDWQIQQRNGILSDVSHKLRDSRNSPGVIRKKDTMLFYNCVPEMLKTKERADQNCRETIELP